MSHAEREKMKLLQRLRKLRGQLDAVERSWRPMKTAAAN
jgi:DNA-binding FrmR family transcriptional regulator